MRWRRTGSGCARGRCRCRRRRQHIRKAARPVERRHEEAAPARRRADRPVIVELAGGRGSLGLPATWCAPWLLTIGRSNSQPASTVRPSSLISRRTVAASGRIQPDVMASRKGMQRLIVRPLLVADACCLSTAGSLRNQSGRTVLAGNGSAMTPWSRVCRGSGPKRACGKNETSWPPTEIRRGTKGRQVYSRGGEPDQRSAHFAAVHQFSRANAHDALFSKHAYNIWRL